VRIASSKTVINRDIFESITADLADKMMAIVERLLETAKLTPANIKVLVGGATRMLVVECRLR